MPCDVLIGFVQLMTQMGTPVSIGAREFNSSIRFALSRSNGASTQDRRSAGTFRNAAARW